MEYAFWFILGLINGSAIVMGYDAWQLRKMEQTKKALLEQIKTRVMEEEKKKNSIKDRLFQASELAQTQMTIKGQLEMPSKNGLHSKYKNELVIELQDLEQKKIEILKSIIADGFDPMITVVNESGTKSEIPLSAYVTEALSTLGKITGSQPPPLPPDATNPKKGNKFIVYKGGKDDGTTH
jgi:hypothetical protein